MTDEEAHEAGTPPLSGNSHVDSSSKGSSVDATDGLRPIVIDGSNIAMSHGNKEVFSWRGIKLAVDYFRARGHKDITVFVPQFRREGHRQDCRPSDRELMSELEKEKIIVFTPSRKVAGKRIVCYDDRYIVKLASENYGIIVSNDNYRDLSLEKPEFKKVIEERLLMYSFVNDRFMPPDDPLGRHGPSLDDFLKMDPPQDPPVQPCPYGKRCTYGAKCRFYHPERVRYTRRASNVHHNEERSCKQSERLCAPQRSYDKTVTKHDDLRAVSSDPVTSRNDLKVDKSACGHLELAKKMSDEYKGMGQQNYSYFDSEQSDTGSCNHRQLSRQLTFRDDNDPRLTLKVRNKNHLAAVQTSSLSSIACSDNLSDSAKCLERCSTEPHEFVTNGRRTRSSSVDITNSYAMTPDRTDPHIFSSSEQQSHSPMACSSECVPSHPCVAVPFLYRENSAMSPASPMYIHPQGMLPCYVPHMYTTPPPGSSPISPMHFSNQVTGILSPQAHMPLPNRYPPNVIHPLHVSSPMFASAPGVRQYQLPGGPRHDTFCCLRSVCSENDACFVMDQFPHESDPNVLCQRLRDMHVN